MCSDEQLLSEETAWRGNDASVLSQMSGRSRPSSGSQMTEPQVTYHLSKRLNEREI